MSGIYKSRLFNFLNRQKMRLANQLGITFRHLQLATETGVKTLLYPVYMLARTSISFRQRLKSNSQSSATQDKISGERNITENDFWLEDGEPNLSGKPDGLSSLTKSHKVNLELSQSRQDDFGAIAPRGLFQKMWNWVKTSVVVSSSSQDLESRSEEESFQGLIRRAIAYFFGNKQRLLSSKNQEALPSAPEPEGGQIQLTSVNLPVVNDSRSQESSLTFFAKVGGWLEKVKATITRSHDPALESTEQESFQVLIRRAIAYFFGSKQQLVLGTNSQILSSSNSIDENSCAVLPFSSFSLPAPSKTLSVTLPFRYWNLSLPSCDQEDNSLSAISTELTISETVSLNIGSGSILLINQTESENLTNIPLEFSSDFWEAEVITVGYVKNLLERILEFLDKITWWIEKQFVKLWQFFKSLTISLFSRLTSRVKTTDN